MDGLEGAVPMAIYTCVPLFQGSLPVWCKITVYTYLYTVVMHLAPGHPPRRPGLDSRPVPMVFVVNKVAQRESLSDCLSSPSVPFHQGKKKR